MNFYQLASIAFRSSLFSLTLVACNSKSKGTPAGEFIPASYTVIMDVDSINVVLTVGEKGSAVVTKVIDESEVTYEEQLSDEQVKIVAHPGFRWPDRVRGRRIERVRRRESC